MEVMVSIVVITSGILFVTRVYSTAKEAVKRSESLFKHSLLLEEKMYDFEERGVIEEDKEGDHFPDEKEYFWEADASSLGFEDPNLRDLCMVKLSVFRGHDPSRPAQPVKYSLATYLEKKK